MSDIQTILAKELKMQRGEKSSKQHLSALQFKNMKEREAFDKTQLKNMKEQFTTRKGV